MTNLLLVQLYAVRAALDAAILAAEQTSGVSPDPLREPGSCPQCGAPEDKLVNLSTLDGARKFRCGVCGNVWSSNLQDIAPAFSQ